MEIFSCNPESLRDSDACVQRPLSTTSALLSSKLHEPDRQTLKRRLVASGVSQQAIQQKSFNLWKNR